MAKSRVADIARFLAIVAIAAFTCMGVLASQALAAEELTPTSNLWNHEYRAPSPYATPTERSYLHQGVAFADALAGAPLAGVNNSTMVLIKDWKSTSLSVLTAAKTRQTVQHAYLLGAKATIDVSNAQAISKSLVLTYVPHWTDTAKNT